MTSSVDNRIVQMDFDNKKFEKGVNQTIKDLETLEKKMQFKDVGSGFSKLESMSNNVKLDGIKNAVESINDKFSIMGVVAFNVISRITNAAMDMFSRLSSATIGTILSGGSTRALNLEQARFQMEGLGMDVEAVMADVSYAVDGTAYSLDAAAKVAGQLGASGIQAGDDMKSSLRGVSGLAAMTGSSYEDVGNIFTKVAGQGRLMGDDLLRLSSRGINGAATLAKYLNKTEAEVRDMVTKGQVDFKTFSDAMNETFGDHATKANETFTGAMSNVKSALGRIGAKFYTPFYENAKHVLNAIRPVINQFSESLDPAFKVVEAGMGKLSGFIQNVLGNIDFTSFASGVNEFSKAITRVFQLGEDSGESIEAGPLKTVYAMKRIMNGLENVLTTVGNIIKPITEAFREVFPVDGVKTLTDITLKFELLTQKFKIGEKQIESIKNGFVLFFTVVRNVATVVGSILSSAFKILQPILKITGTLIGYLVQIFMGFLGIIESTASPMEAFTTSLDKISTKIKGFLTNLSNSMPTIEQFGETVTRAKDSMILFGRAITEKMAAAMGILQKVFQPVLDGLKKLKDSAGQGLSNINWNNILLGAGLATAVYSVKKIFDTLYGVFFQISTLIGPLKNAANVLSTLKGTLFAYQQDLKAKTLLTIASAVLILAVALTILSTLNIEEALLGVTVIGALMGELMGSLKLLSIINPGKLVGVAASMILVSTAIVILTGAMKMLASLSWEEIAKGTVALIVLSGVLIGLTAAMNAIKSKAIGGAMSMIIIGAALLVLAEALKKLGSIDQNVLIQGFIAMTASLAVLVVALNFMKSAVGGAVAMVIISAALIVLAEALEKFGTLPLEVLKQGGIAVIAMLTALVIAVNLMKSAVGGAVAMLIISAALLVLSNVIGILGAMPIEQITQGMIMFIAMLTTFVIVGMLLAPIAVQVLLVSVALLIFATGLMIAAASLIVMSIGLNLLLAAGLPAIGMLALLGLALIPLVIISPLLFIFGAGMLFMGVGLLAAGAGLVLFSVAGVGAVGILLALGLAMIPLLAAAPLMFIVGVAMLTLGIASIALGGGLMILSIAFTLLASSAPLGLEAMGQIAEKVAELTPLIPIIAAAGVAFIALGAGALVAGAGLLVLGLGMMLASVGILLFSKTVSGAFTDAVSIFDEAMGTFVWHTPGMLAAGAALLVFGAGVMLAGSAALIAGAGFLILESAIKIFTTTYPKLESSMGKFVELTGRMDTIIPSLNSLESSMTLLSTSMTSFGFGIATAASGTISLASGVKILASNIQIATVSTTTGSTQIISSMNLLVTSVSGSITRIGVQYTLFGTSTRTSMLLVESIMSSSSSKIIAVMTSMNSSIATTILQTRSQFAKMGPAISDGVATAIPIAQAAGQNIIHGCLNGMSMMMSLVYAKGMEVGRKAVDGVNVGAGNASPSKKTFKSGVNVDQGAINGMLALLTQVGKTGELVGITAADSVIEGFKTLDDSFGGAGFSPTIKPVVDFSKLSSGIQKMNGAFKSSTYDLDFGSLNLPKDGTLADSINNLSDKVNQMSTDLMNIQICLDGTTLVGKLAPRIDSALGSRQQRLEVGF